MREEKMRVDRRSGARDAERNIYCRRYVLWRLHPTNASDDDDDAWWRRRFYFDAVRHTGVHKIMYSEKYKRYNNILLRYCFYATALLLLSASTLPDVLCLSLSLNIFFCFLINAFGRMLCLTKIVHLYVFFQTLRIAMFRIGRVCMKTFPRLRRRHLFDYFIFFSFFYRFFFLVF